MSDPDRHNADHAYKKQQYSGWLIFGIGIALLIIAFGALFSIYRIGPYQVGVRVTQDGEISALAPGFHFKWKPTTAIYTISTEPVEQGTNQLAVATTDNFNMSGTVVEYTRRLSDEETRSLITQTPNFAPLVQSTVAQQTKNTIGNYELITVPENRSQIEQEIRLRVNEVLAEQFGVDDMLVNITLASYQWEQAAQEHLAQVRDRQEQIRTAELQAERQSVEDSAALERERNRAEQRRIESESQKQAAITQAEGEAEATRLRSQAALDDLRSKVDVFGLEGALALERFERWNGQLPQFTGGVSDNMEVQLPPSLLTQQ